VDNSFLSRSVLRRTAELARRGDARVVVLHVGSAPQPELEAQSGELLADIRYRFIYREGAIAEAILQTAEQERCYEVILGQRQCFGFGVPGGFGAQFASRGCGCLRRSSHPEANRIMIGRLFRNIGMVLFVQTIWLLSALLLVVVILLHSPKGDGLGGFGGQAQMFSSTKSAETALNRATWVLTVLFLGTTVVLSGGWLTVSTPEVPAIPAAVPVVTPAATPTEIPQSLPATPAVPKNED
jgi:preprotein translocase subunit SecG